uniref:Uncharacterized protein n=1 Tax=viral metagenome TaxID=1070528 RepID=A0A6M3L783_9ZZZZ
MAKVKRPEGNQIYHFIKRKFSWEGFCNLDIIEAFSEIGFSKTEARRLLDAGSIKIWDTRIQDSKVQWYKRRVRQVELVEPGDVLVFGKPKVLLIEKIPFTLYETLYYKLRLLKERILEWLEYNVNYKRYSIS